MNRLTDPFERRLPVIAVDGTAASGKGTLARRLAAHYGFAYLDTGLLYRFLGVESLRQGIAIDDPQAAGAFAEAVVTRLAPETLSDPAFRAEDAGPAASRVAKHPRVRAALLKLQKDFMIRPPKLADGTAARGSVLDGRDIGSVIAPDAAVKFFVTADVSVRARRRFDELQAGGSPATYDQVLADMIGRDSRDAQREAAPMVATPDAVTIDTSTMTIQDVLDFAIRQVDGALPAAGKI